MGEGTQSEQDSQRYGDAPALYRRLIPVCEDSMGTTWLGAVVRGPDAGRQVLMTVVPQGPDSLLVRPLLSAARREIKARHFSLLALLDIELRPDSVILVSESLEGEPLSTLMGTAAKRGEPIPSAVALHIVKEAVLALRALRQKSPLAWPHGLLNPETIFVASCGEVLLRQPETRASALKVVGYASHPSFLSYRAPEMLRDAREDESCADVFSAGVLLWEMMAGRGLYGSPDSYRLGRVKGLPPVEVERIRQGILNEHAPSLTTLGLHGAAVSPDVARLVDWMLSHDPAGRPQSLDELVRVFDGLPSASIATGPEMGHFVHRLLSETFETRARLVADAVAPPPQQVAGGSNSERRSSSPPAFIEPRTTPRAVALATRLARDVPAVEEEPPPAAVVSIPAARRPARRDGLLMAAAGLLLAGGLGGYLLMEGGTSTEAAAPEEVVIDEGRHRVGMPREAPSSSPPEASGKPQEDPPDAGKESKPSTASEPSGPSTPRKTSVPAKKKSPSPSSKTGFRPTGI